jgi:hypothetical protein
MKTPREILLEQHRSAAPKLDAIRREVLAGKVTPARAGGSGALAAVWLNWPVVLWRELIWPCRRIWTGLAAVWILIFVFNVSQRDPSELLARKTPTPTPEMILAFRQQERLLAELIGPNETRSAEPTPKPFLPQPRSEGRFETLAA